MAENANLWFLQPPKQEANPNQQILPPAFHQQSNATNPFNKVTQSPPPQNESAYPTPQSVYAQPPYPPPHGSPHPPPHQGSPYPQQQGSPYPTQQGSPYPPQQGGPFSPQQGTPYPQQQGPPYPQQSYPPQQNVYAQSGQYPPQKGYPQQQGSFYQQQGYPQQDFGQPQSRQSTDPNSQPGGEAASFYGSGPPPAPPGPGERGFFDSAMQIAGVQQPQTGPDGLDRGWFSSSKNPLDPPPKMFKRPAPGHYAYIQFRPVSVLAVSEKLQDGFALMPPVTAPGDPHPFISHDITEEDWHKFLKDFQKTAHLSASDRLFQGMANSFMRDKIPSAKVQQRMAENKLEPIGDYLVAWNHYFFRPRRMSVVLARGTHRYSGETDDYPPDVSGHTKKSSKEKKDKDKKDKKSHKTRSADVPLVTAAEPYPKGSLIGDLLNPLHKAIHDTTMVVATAPTDALYGTHRGVYTTPSHKLKKHSDSDDSDSSSSSSSSEGGDCMSKHKKKVAERRAEREYRREERRARREERKEGKHGKKAKESAVEIPSGRFRLVLCYWDGQREVF